MFVSDEKMHEIFTLCTLYKIQYSKSTVCLYDLQYKWEIENMIRRMRIWPADDRALFGIFFIINSNVLLFTLVSLSLQLFLVLSVSYISLTPPQDCSIINKNMLGP